jgi:hypothetical protein
VKRLAVLLVVVAIAGIAIALVIDGGSDNKPTAEQIEQRLFESPASIVQADEHPRSVSCRPLKKHDYFDCVVMLRPKGKAAKRLGYPGYKIRVKAIERAPGYESVPQTAGGSQRR